VEFVGKSEILENTQKNVFIPSFPKWGEGGGGNGGAFAEQGTAMSNSRITQLNFLRVYEKYTRETKERVALKGRGWVLLPYNSVSQGKEGGL